MNNDIEQNKITDEVEVVEEVNTQDEKFIKDDILRYSTNKSSFLLCILAIILNVAMFLIVYKLETKADNSSGIANWLLGLDLLVNVMLTIGFFLLAEKTKAYVNKATYYCYGAAGLEVVRIFILPLRLFLVNVEYQSNPSGPVGLTIAKFIWVVVLLIGAAASLAGAGYINYVKGKRLHNHLVEIGAVK